MQQSHEDSTKGVQDHKGEPHEGSVSLGIVGDFVKVGKVDIWVDTGG